MAAPIQQSNVYSGTPGPSLLQLLGVAGGSDLVVLIGRESSASREYIITTNLDAGDFVLVGDSRPSLGSFPQYIFVKFGVSAGNHDISIAQVTGTAQNMFCTAFECTGLDPLATPIASTFYDGINDGDHYAGAVGDVDTTGPTLMFVIGRISGSNSGTVEGAGWTKGTVGGNQQYFGWRNSISAESDQRGNFTNIGTARFAYACMVAFPLVSGGSPATFDGALNVTASLTGALSTQITMAGAMAASVAATGALSTQIALAGSAASAFGVTGALSTAIALNGNAAMAMAASGDLLTSIALGGSVPIAIAASANLTTQIQLAASVGAVFGVTGGLVVGSGLSGDLGAAFALTGDLSTAIALTGALPVVVSNTGQLLTVISFAGALPMAWDVTGALLGNSTLAGAADMVLGLSGALSTAIALGGAAPMSVQVSGALATALALAGATPLTVGVTGDLSTAIALGGTLPVSVGVTGDLFKPSAALVGTAAMSLGLTGALSTAIHAQGTVAMVWAINGDLVVVNVPVTYYIVWVLNEAMRTAGVRGESFLTPEVVQEVLRRTSVTQEQLFDSL
jgi:hypothetical protein